MKKAAISLVALLLLMGLPAIPAAAATDYAFNYTITANGTEDVATFPDQAFNWTVEYEVFTICYGDCLLWDLSGRCILRQSWPCWVTETASGSGVVNTLEGDKLIFTTSFSNNVKSVNVDNPNVTTSIVLSFPFYYVYVNTNYSETGTQPWSAIEDGSSSVNALEGDKYITTSNLVAPNGDTTWSVTDDNPHVDSWMLGNQLYARAYDGIVPIEVGGELYPVDKLAILAPWIALAAAIIAGATMAMRRRRAQS